MVNVTGQRRLQHLGFAYRSAMRGHRWQRTGRPWLTQMTSKEQRQSARLLAAASTLSGSVIAGVVIGIGLDRWLDSGTKATAACAVGFVSLASTIWFGNSFVRMMLSEHLATSVVGDSRGMGAGFGIGNGGSVVWL